MAMSQRSSSSQGQFWIPTDSIVTSPGHPFYERLNALLEAHGFDAFVEDLCRPFYAEKVGRPSIPPGVYFRMLLIGYFEGLDSERAIAWRCADSLALRSFLGYGLDRRTPDHSSLSVIRQRLGLETHERVFCWVLKVLCDNGLLRGETLGVDATTLEANAALRSLVRRETGQSYQAFLTELAKASGIETPTREDRARLDRQRPNKGPNDDWQHPHDPDAKIAKMKDGRTHMAHKAEHAVDLHTGAIVAVTLQPANAGDTATLPQTVSQTQANLEEVREAIEAEYDDDVFCEGLEVREVVADKGYHSNRTLRDLQEQGIRGYVAEPRRRGRRHWRDKKPEQRAVYGNRRRIRGDYGKGLLRKRGELLERSFAHCYRTGGLRRVHLRGHERILPRLLMHVAGFNLALVMRGLFGRGTPRGLWDLVRGLLRFVLSALSRRMPSQVLIWRRICNTVHDLPGVPFLPYAA